MTIKNFTLLVLLGSLVTLASCSKNSNDVAESAAGQFFSTIHSGDSIKAYSMTSRAFRQVTNKDQFSAFTTLLGLRDYADIKWYGHGQLDSLAYAEGLLVRKDSSKMSVKVHLLLDSGSWKVSGIEQIAGFGLAGNISGMFPPDQTVYRLVAAYLSLLDSSIRTKDFTPLYNTMSRLGRSSTSKEALAASFQQFIDKQVNVGAAANAQFYIKPYLSSDAPNQPRILLVECQFMTKPAPLRMTMKFTLDPDGWRLYTLSASL